MSEQDDRREPQRLLEAIERQRFVISRVLEVVDDREIHAYAALCLESE